VCSGWGHHNPTRLPPDFGLQLQTVGEKVSAVCKSSSVLSCHSGPYQTLQHGDCCPLSLGSALSCLASTPQVLARALPSVVLDLPLVPAEVQLSPLNIREAWLGKSAD
jgi:hypothetical protein